MQRFYLQENELGKKYLHNALDLKCSKSTAVLVKNRIRSQVFISFASQTLNLLRGTKRMRQLTMLFKV